MLVKNYPFRTIFASGQVAQVRPLCHQFSTNERIFTTVSLKTQRKLRKPTPPGSTSLDYVVDAVTAIWVKSEVVEAPVPAAIQDSLAITQRNGIFIHGLYSQLSVAAFGHNHGYHGQEQIRSSPNAHRHLDSCCLDVLTRLDFGKHRYVARAYRLPVGEGLSLQSYQHSQ